MYFKTCRGFIKGSFSYYLGIDFAFEAELIGFILAIEIAYNWNWYNLWVETDSSDLVGSFDNVIWKFRNRWARDLILAKRLQIRISHIYRERNCVADKFASLSTTSGTKKWWFGAPEDIMKLTYRYMIHLPLYRIMNL